MDTKVPSLPFFCRWPCIMGGSGGALCVVHCWEVLVLTATSTAVSPWSPTGVRGSWIRLPAWARLGLPYRYARPFLPLRRRRTQRRNAQPDTEAEAGGGWRTCPRCQPPYARARGGEGAPRRGDTIGRGDNPSGVCSVQSSRRPGASSPRPPARTTSGNPSAVAIISAFLPSVSVASLSAPAATSTSVISRWPLDALAW